MAGDGSVLKAQRRGAGVKGGRANSDFGGRGGGNWLESLGFGRKAPGGKLRSPRRSASESDVAMPPAAPPGRRRPRRTPVGLRLRAPFRGPRDAERTSLRTGTVRPATPARGRWSIDDDPPLARRADHSRLEHARPTQVVVLSNGRSRGQVRHPRALRGRCSVSHGPQRRDHGVVGSRTRRGELLCLTASRLPRPGSRSSSILAPRELTLRHGCSHSGAFSWYAGTS